jgi:hypothetical protein
VILHSLRTVPFTCAILAFLAVSIAGRSVSGGPEQDIAPLLGFDEGDVSRALRGAAVVHGLDAQDDREVAIAGMIAVRVTPETFIRRLEDIEDFKRADAVRQIKKVSTPPVLGDFADLQLEPSEVSALRHCRLGNCDLQLPASAIGSLEHVPWTTATAADQALGIVKRMLHTHASTYMLAPGTARMVYQHRRRDVDVAREFRDLVNDDRWLLPRLPTLRERLLRGHMQVAPSLPEFLYWSREAIGRKVVLSLTHVAVEAPSGLPGSVAIASKQLYASHYFYSSLGLTVLIPDASVPGTTVVIYVNRSRVDAFSGVFGGMLRRIVRGRAESALAHYLLRLRMRLERAS